ncbi:E3 ubiquitin/ISG15 ligase TRIM25 [Thalassophryne amazonica]|uniref:E3 ubiquitin/ISG15 ligase TRIM25 n=1 Tax=Thalassophryne amazonica TaxID=390379 RepID=UPI001471D958|nr:E3 ubiquitin/ISG15 ligase TRIM25 [Thalassophryne amazonica]
MVRFQGGEVVKADEFKYLSQLFRVNEEDDRKMKKRVQCCVASTIAALDEDLTCSVCRDTFTHAEPLPCGHSFCPTCIREAWGSQSEGKGHFTCPQCQEEHSEVLGDCCPPEADGGKAPLAVKTCLTCEVSLCAAHLQPHLERPAFSTHLLVDPLGDLSQQRCPTHTEIFRYFCTNERVYMCGDCLLEGGHTQHKVKLLRQVEKDLKVILETMFRKAEEKLKNGEQILEEHQNLDSTVADETQVEHLGSNLQVHVKKLVAALREITKKDRKQVIERVHDDCCRVREDMVQTQRIQHFLTSLLAESDPFLLIWAFQSDDTKLLADLESPLFIPHPVSLDRKHILEDTENKYREFIAATLHCLSELKRELLTSPLTLDTNSAHPLLTISESH